MSLKLIALLLGLSGILGIFLGYFLRYIISLGKRGSMELEIKEKLLAAREEAKNITFKAEEEARVILEKAREDIKHKEDSIKIVETRLLKKEDAFEKREQLLLQETEHVKAKIEEVKTIKEHITELESQKIKELEKIAGLSADEAQADLIKTIEKNSAEDLLIRMQKLEIEGEDRLQRKAQEILAISIQRFANSVAQDLMSTVVSIPNDDIKGKIIGKEGRNIKTFERATGTEVIVDDTPGAVTISSFDPVRRQIARIALEELVRDGRIQPAKIEKIVEEASLNINKIIKEKGEQAVFETGIIGLDPRLVLILGRLHFRTSYGQNVLQHSIEMAHIAGMIAEELGANVIVAKTGALLHDIGKALDHEVTGTHVEIGRKLLQKFNVSEDIIKAMQAHHEEYPYETVESRIVQTADAISGSRPGARRDSIENYIKRLTDLENIAQSFKGIDKAYALQAGREIRVFVTPESITDIEAKNLARSIALKIEKELRFPGEIKVNVIRETRAIEFAR